MPHAGQSFYDQLELCIAQDDAARHRAAKRASRRKQKRKRQGRSPKQKTKRKQRKEQQRGRSRATEETLKDRAYRVSVTDRVARLMVHATIERNSQVQLSGTGDMQLRTVRKPPTNLPSTLLTKPSW